MNGEYNKGISDTILITNQGEFTIPNLGFRLPKDNTI